MNLNPIMLMSFRACAVLICCAGPALGQEARRDTAQVPAVIVTATRVPMPRTSLPVAVTVITGAELQLKGITTVADALASVSSAYVAQSGSQGAQTSLFLRGGESKYVKVLLDGVPVNSPGGTYDFGALTTDNVERIEIVRGPASVVYGADAVTGVVNVITRRGTGPGMDVEVRSGAMPRDRRLNTGSMSTADVSVGAQGSVGTSAYSLRGARHVSGGLYDQNNYYGNNTISGTFDASPAASTMVRFSGRYTDYKYSYPTNGGGDVRDLNAFRTEDRTALGVVVERQTGTRLRTVLAASLSETDGGTDDQPDSTGANTFVSLERTRRRGIELWGNGSINERLTLTTGVQFEQQDQRTQFQSDGAFGPFNDRFSASRRNQAAYAEVVAQPTTAFALTLGARADFNEQFGTFPTYRGGISWQPVSGTRVRATAGTAFREPTFAENYSVGFFAGNPDLKPERTQSFDGGVDQALFNGRVLGSVTAFAQRFRNMIDFEPTVLVCGFAYCNVAVATSNGVELEARGQVAGPISASVAATLLKTKVVEPGYDSTSGGQLRRGESLIRRPERKVTADVEYRGAGPLSASLRALAVGIRTDRDFRSFTPVVLPSYERFDASAEYV
ncbi:MAG: TonB-dependent receptor plug domain-containing protein, partial [Gemmatimonadaceae bacterium]